MVGLTIATDAAPSSRGLLASGQIARLRGPTVVRPSAATRT
jgi:hypothetical protein